MNPYENLHIAPDAPHEGWEGREFPAAGLKLRYRIRLPQNLNDGSRHPLLLVMHGAGSIGDDNLRQLYLAGMLAKQAPADAVIVAPQCPRGQYWVPCAPDWDADGLTLTLDPTPALGAVMELMESLLTDLPVDYARVYLAGASMGGFAAWELLFRREWFAAAVIVCGAGDPEKVKGLGTLPVKLFHGEADPTVPVRASRAMAARAETVELTEYQGIGHDAWTPAFSDPDTAAWLFAQRQTPIVTMAPGGGETLTLEAHGFHAEIAPAAGGNLFRLRDGVSGRALLREPLTLDQLRHATVCYGLPTLFPPTRIPGGRFTWNGREYALPLNEPDSGNHLHGLVAGQPWETVRADGESATLRYSFTPADPRFAGFPHGFTLEHTYRLLPDGLEDTLEIANRGSRAMPLGLGFHTAFNAAGATVRLGAGEYEFALDDRNLPTGERLPWGDCDPREDFDHRGHDFDFVTRVAPLTDAGGRTFPGAELHTPEGTLVYEIDPKFGFWCVWNGGGFNKFICIEPLSWIVDAPHCAWPAAKSGWRELAGGDRAVFTNRLHWTRRA